jgi:hypothetical protein
MFKRLLLFFFCYSLLPSLYAGSMGYVNDYPLDNHIYLGGNLGIAGLLDKDSQVYTPAAHHQSAVGVLGGGFLGFEYAWNEQFRLSIECFGNATGLSATATQNYVTRAQYTAAMSYNVGARLLPGMMLTQNTQGYVTLGYASGHFSADDNGNYGYVNDSFSLNGIQSGIGMKTIIYQALSLRLDALYTYYGSHHSYGYTAVGRPQVYENTLATLETNLALVYTF